MLTSSFRGLVAALRQPKLAFLLWTWNLLVALVVTWPVWTWWSRAVRYSPGTDPMLDRFHLGILKELLHADRTGDAHGGTVEDRHEAVAGVLDLATTRRVHRGSDEREVLVSQAIRRAGADA